MMRKSKSMLRAGKLLVGISMLALGLCFLPRRASLPERPARPAPSIQRMAGLFSAEVQRARAVSARLPLHFEPAADRFASARSEDSPPEFVSRGPGYWMELRRDAIVIAGPRSLREGAAPLRIRLANASPATRLQGSAPLPGVSNYYLGRDPSQWRTGIRQYARVEYHGLYEGVDAVFYGSPQQMEFDFVVAPFADPGVILLEFGEQVAIQRSENGDLVAEADGEQVRLQRPVIYQEIAGGRRLIAGGFVVDGSRVGFRVEDYDRSQPLVLDPVLLYSSYLGGGDADVIEDVALDAGGNILLVGSTQSANFPTVSGIQSALRGASDGFITKLNPAGTAVVYSTYLGGNAADALAAIAVDPTGSIWVVGHTNSNNFPLLNALQTVIGAGFDAVAVHISPAGLLQFSTYMGGNGDDFARAVALDAASSIYVAGDTFSTNLPVGISAQPNYGGGAPANCPTTGAGQPLGGDAFVFKLSSSGSSRLYTTYLGGSGCEAGRGIAVDGAGNAYVTGATNSVNFPTAAPLQVSLGGGTCVPSGGGASFACPDAFVAKLNAGGTALAYSTYLGGNGLDDGAALAVDSDGAAYAAGTTQSGNFPLFQALDSTLGGPQDAFLAKLNAAGSALVYSTLYGGSGSEAATALRLNAARRAYLAGTTNSGDLLLSNAVRSALAGGMDAFAATVNASGNGLSFSTYFGSPGEDHGLGLALDASGNIWMGGFTDSSSFPTTFSPLQISSAGGRDGFLVKFSAVAGVPAVNAGGVVNNASFAPAPAPLAPGSIAAVFGSNLNDGSIITSSTIGPDGKLVTTLGGSSATVNSIPAPIFYSTPGQIGIQIPFELANLSFGTLRVTVAGETSEPVNIPISNFAPGIFTVNQQGTGLAAALHEDGVTPVTGGNPAHLNEVIVFFGTGLGVASPPLATGERSGGNPTSTPATATVGGAAAIVEFSGTAPGFVGLNQINVRIPAGIATGPAVPVVFNIGGQAANPVTIPVAP